MGALVKNGQGWTGLGGVGGNVSMLHGEKVCLFYYISKLDKFFQNWSLRLENRKINYLFD
jgi:hypothetical protein